MHHARKFAGLPLASALVLTLAGASTAGASVRLAFEYPWYSGTAAGATHYHPNLAASWPYDSGNSAVIRKQIDSEVRAPPGLHPLVVGSGHADRFTRHAVAHRDHEGIARRRWFQERSLLRGRGQLEPGSRIAEPERDPDHVGPELHRLAVRQQPELSQAQR
jgi:hypothetical protein